MKFGMFWALLVLWTITMAVSLWWLCADATGDGFTRGLNRVMGFLGWQLAGALLALPLWKGVRELGGWRRWLGRVPAIWALGLIGAVVLYILIGVRSGGA
jgi:hypothetical protein